LPGCKPLVMRTTLFTVPEFLPASACESLIAETEQAGFEPAPVTTARGFVMMPELRNNTRRIVDDPGLAAELWQRLEHHPALPRVPGWQVVGLNERFRFYRYEPGQAFRWHRDGAFVRHMQEQSFLTFMVYLNDGFGGGATEFKHTCVVPRRGSALVFAHPLPHQGAEVTSGIKYVLRSDVMYRAA